MIERDLVAGIRAVLPDKKAVIVLGPRQSGKSTLLEQLSPHLKAPVLWMNGDESDVRALFSNPTSAQLKSLIGTHRTLVIDEAQRIENIGICIKLIVDQLKGVKVIATGSSAFELANQINEPLTGRKWEFRLMPLSFGEMVSHTSLLDEKRQLQSRLVYGYYPEIVTESSHSEKRLKELADSYLYKDILTWERIQKPDKLEKLTQALSFQVAQVISNHELGQLCGLNAETVEKYIQLLEKAFVVYRLYSYSRNPRNELKKSCKIYFCDNGIRNAVINQFNPVRLRADAGQLWENWFITERIKYLRSRQRNASSFFWRTLAKQEVDYVEESDGKLLAIECKWGNAGRGKVSRAFSDRYQHAACHVATPGTAEQFLLYQGDK